MAIRSEVQRRANHFGRLMRAGLSRLWQVVVVGVAVVGGSVLLTVHWGAKHIFWGLVIILAVMVLVVVEGSYRESRRSAAAHVAALAAEQAKNQAALESQRRAHEAELAALPTPNPSPTHSAAAITAAAKTSRMSAPHSSAVSLEKLRRLIVEGEAMRGRVADRRGPAALAQAGLPESVADWEARVSAVLAPWPELLAQFQGALAPRIVMLPSPAGELHDKLEERLKVLYAIVRGLEGRP